MERDWEHIFREWSKPSSETESAKAENAERRIREAIEESPTLAKMNTRVFAQGSYRNNTNVRIESDVDICVMSLDYLDTDFSMAGTLQKGDFGLVDSGYTYAQFKDAVGQALIDKFGEERVARGNKAFDVHANSYSLDADVVPCFQHRRYKTDRSYHEGTAFWPDKGGKTINWPEQHYLNGVEKNKATGSRFKYMVRALKRLKNEMTQEGVAEAEPIPSFLAECLVWNSPNNLLGNDRYYDDMKAIIAHTWNATKEDAGCREWGEVNELKYLFRPSQPWSREQANAFLLRAWNYVGFKS